MLMDIDKLKTFYQVVRYGSFSKAVDGVNLSQSAISRQIQQLEDRLHTKLFHRHSRGLSLTKAGEVLYEKAGIILSEMASLQHEIKNQMVDAKVSLKISTTPEFSAYYLIPLIPSFMESRPEMQLSIQTDEFFPKLATDGNDATICPYLHNQRDIEQHPLFRSKIGLYASPNYLTKFGVPRTIEDLDRHKLIGYGEQKGSLYKLYNWHLSQGRSGKPSRTPALQANQSMARIELALKDFGIIALDERHPQLKRVKLNQILEDFDSPSVEYFYAYPKVLKDTRQVMDLYEYLLSSLSQTRYVV